MRIRAVAKQLVTSAIVFLVLAGSTVATSAQQPWTVEKLLSGGWDIAGYISAWENRSLILFKHKDHNYLVQCSVLIDVLRNPRQVIACYEIR